MMKLAPIALASAFLAFAPAHAVDFYGALDGSQEVPPNMSPATGYGTIDITGDIMTVEIFYSNLTVPLTVAHIHCCAPVGVGVGIAVDLDKDPLPVTLTGSFTRMFDLTDLTTYRAAFVGMGGTAESARMKLIDAFNAETAYFNLHTTAFPGGEIRGQIAAVPEPASWALMIAGFGLVGAAMRRRNNEAARPVLA